MVITIDNVQALLRGANLTAYDENLKPLDRVSEFDTETFRCSMASNGVRVAAGYVVVCNKAWQLGYLLENAPRSIVPFIYPKVARGNEADHMEQIERFMRKHVDHYSEMHEQAVFGRGGDPFPDDAE